MAMAMAMAHALVVSMALLQVLMPQDAAAQRLLRVATDDVCTSVREISTFVVAHCDSNGAALGTKCVESFEEYARDSDVFDACEAREDFQQQQPTLLRFKELYSNWQQTHICERFHASERKAAHECSGDNVHRPWNEATWPLFCHETFMSYKENRKDIDALCSRTESSAAFWEGYADYVASPTCKQYYDFVRDAAKRGCGSGGESEGAVACVKMFEWYREKQQRVEVECLELHNAKPFYRGFYKWKKHAF